MEGKDSENKIVICVFFEIIMYKFSLNSFEKSICFVKITRNPSFIQKHFIQNNFSFISIPNSLFCIIAVTLLLGESIGHWTHKLNILAT